MKKIVCCLLAIFIVSLCGCTEKTQIVEGKDNEKLVGCWVFINETTGASRIIRYWEFDTDNQGYMVDYVKTEDSQYINEQLYEEAPYQDMLKTYVIENDCEVEKIYDFSYTEGYGLEYKSMDNGEYKITDFMTEKQGWYFEFVNENKFILTTEYSVYHGYRMKQSLLSQEQKENAK